MVVALAVAWAAPACATPARAVQALTATTRPSAPSIWLGLPATDDDATGPFPDPLTSSPAWLPYEQIVSACTGNCASAPFHCTKARPQIVERRKIPARSDEGSEPH